jgi:hypothetical protein
MKKIICIPFLFILCSISNFCVAQTLNDTIEIKKKWYVETYLFQQKKLKPKQLVALLNSETNCKPIMKKFYVANKLWNNLFSSALVLGITQAIWKDEIVYSKKTISGKILNITAASFLFSSYYFLIKSSNQIKKSVNQFNISKLSN